MTELFFSGAGRVARARYWLITTVGGVLGLALYLIGELGNHRGAYVLYFAIFWPLLLVGIKRYHDRGKSGLWFLILFIPVIGTIWQAIELGFLRGVAGPNKYGPDPLMIESEKPI